MTDSRSAAADGYFVDPALMASSFEAGVEKRVDYAQRLFGFDEPGGKGKHVGIVVLACQPCQFHVPAQSRAYSLMLVEGDGYAIAASADGDAGIVPAFLHGNSQRMGEVGVVAAICAVGSEVVHTDALAFEVAYDKVLEFVACVVAADSRADSWFEYHI